ncbi:polysaccharide biosynthesis/export family protein [Brevundimonas nasdae]
MRYAAARESVGDGEPMSPWRLCVIALALLASACASTGGRDSAQPYDFAPWGRDDYQYRLGAGDALRLSFIVEDGLDKDVTLGPDGQGAFPVVGPIPVGGLTVRDASQRLTEAYAPVLRNPQVQISVVTYGASQIYVGGEVKTPGVVQIRGEMNTAQAILAAGGFAETAGTGKVVILRRVADGRLASRIVDAGALINADQRQDFLLHPGDLVFVPRSRIAEVNLFVRQYLNGILPFNFGFSYDLNRFR